MVLCEPALLEAKLGPHMQTHFTYALQQIGVGLMAEFLEDSILLLEKSLDTVNTMVYFLQIDVS